MLFSTCFHCNILLFLISTYLFDTSPLNSQWDCSLYSCYFSLILLLLLVPTPVIPQSKMNSSTKIYTPAESELTQLLVIELLSYAIPRDRPHPSQQVPLRLDANHSSGTSSASQYNGKFLSSASKILAHCMKGSTHKTPFCSASQRRDSSRSAQQRR
jgi:hypothetical protein